jgi:uncharacterized protein YndB with AHSA1/START domain
MASTMSERKVSESLVSGAVKVSRELKASPMEVWQALTDPALVAQWFGTLSTPLAQGQPACLSFGDGDFFTLQEILLDPPHTLKYSWRFLGIGPLDTITWQISPGVKACRVKVTDTEPERTREAALELRKGWLDFTKRLKLFFQKGKPTRYGWRHDLDGSIELPASIDRIWDHLFEARSQALWLPLEASSLVEGAEFVVGDGAGSARLRVSDVVSQPPSVVSFRLAHEAWLNSTDCRLELLPRKSDTLLYVSHNNWGAISPDEEYQKQQRKRFCELWINALMRARYLIA